MYDDRVVLQKRLQSLHVHKTVRSLACLRQPLSAVPLPDLKRDNPEVATGGTGAQGAF